MNNVKNSPDLLSKSLRKLPTETKKDFVWLLRHSGFEEKPVCVREFIDSPDFLGLGDQCRRRLKNELERIFGTKEELEKMLNSPTNSKKMGMVNYALFTGAIGIGKCHGKNTKILMYDGSIKNVQDIIPGELLMGDDSTPRKVLNIVSGREEMFRVKPIKGESFVVNRSHILSLKRTNNSRYTINKIDKKAGEIINISVDNYLKKGNNFKSLYKLYRVPVNFKNKRIAIDPYFLGVWLGDGNNHSIGITTKDKEIKDLVHEQASRYNLSVLKSSFYGRCPTYTITGGERHWHNYKNKILFLFKKYNLLHNKHIPIQYKTNNQRIRLEVLAGLIDTDGSREGNCFTITNKNKVLADDAVYIARSLGFGVNISPRITSCNGNQFKSYRITISGDCDRIPVRLERKKCHKRLQKKNVLVTGFKLESLGVGDYCGFQIDNNHLYLLGDFTVTHNTFITGVAFSYMIYRLLILKNPQRYYNLAPGTRIAIMEMSTSGHQALNVIFSEIKARVENCPWFMRYYPYDPNYSNQLRFKKNVFVIPGDSQETTFEGYNIIAGAIDELDSHKKTATKDYAQVGFETIDVRITSRFHKNGLLFLLGSMKSATGSANYYYYLLRKRTDANVSRLTIWDSRNKEDFCGKKFYFDVNDKKIVTEEIGNVIKIPEEYRNDFKSNPDKALRDLAGIPPYAQQPFFSMADKVKNGFSDYSNPINENGAILEGFAPQDLKKRIVHVDLGINKDGGDACGIAMGHIEDFKEVEGDRKPIIKMDFMTELKAPPGGEIMISDIRLLIYELIDRGFKIVRVTYDGWQSAESLQALRKRRIPARILSIDKDTVPYESLKEALYEKRLKYPRYLPFIDECIQLEYIEGGKIDHPPKGKKDVSDAVAGVVFNLVTSSIARPHVLMKSSLGGKSLLAKVGGINAPQEIKL